MAYPGIKSITTPIFICVLFLAFGFAEEVSVDSKINDINAWSSSNCGENQFTCRNRECIASELLCDGRADCSDQSDETQFECTKPELTCPDYVFRCNYGACVNGDAACNGIKDCLDNSDEALARCPGISAAANLEFNTCGPDDTRCKNGQCINATSLCDGVINCADGSDETFDSCGSISCPPFVFRCNYGACIDQKLVCDGFNNCADGSDEDLFLCGRPAPDPIAPTPTATPPPRIPDLPNPKASRCLVPPQPTNGQWKLHRELCSNGVECDIAQGVELEPGSQLVYTCSEGYKIRGTTNVYCGVTGYWSPIPICVEVKCPGLNSASTTSDCRLFGEYVSCDSPVLPKTRAQVSCRVGYSKDTTLMATHREIVECNATGNWEPDPIKCIPVCGVSRTHQTPLVANGMLAKLGDFPWHATLYMENESTKVFKCGATVIQTKLILTAAHCVYNENTRSTEDPEKLFVITGNVFRDYDSPLHDPQVVRKGEVKNVYTNCNYYGFTGNYASDIALLELKQPFEFSSFLLPACLDVSGMSEQVLEPGAFGKVAGFGSTVTGSSSAILQTLNLPYISYSECRSSNLANGNEIFISNDKFCAGFNNGSAVCPGDSGGGLVFKKGDQWYVMGIVSLALGTDANSGERICDRFSFSLYTKVSTYMSWIQDVMFQLEQYQYYPSCDTTMSSVRQLSN